ncbi:phycobilisome protein [Oscillatoria sp. FACHB-1407]|uniref:phycobilisome protein n=1 Tax=Oscillatoria sp. FACHB-1407 TaxID=2692847 RepID=UPI00168661D4|nr:phycobilisome protein [Oscillatoria sp. FACHB-1407]MBD2460983.1 phycobilisome protein [Oscillatoria sp. FACHB-1407]
MLSQANRLSSQIDGRYADDIELQFISEYIQSFRLRLQTYEKLQAAEAEIVQQVYDKMQVLNPGLFAPGNTDLSSKWKRDTIRTLRYSATAMLVNDPETLQERFLSWFQTIMRSFGAQQSCNTTYEIMQEVVKQHLTTAQANLFCPILALNQRYLGAEV